MLTCCTLRIYCDLNLRYCRAYKAQVAWQAPEYFRQDTVGYTDRIDVYSIGIVALELAYGTTPFEGMLPTATMLLKLQDETGTRSHCI